MSVTYSRSFPAIATNKAARSAVAEALSTLLSHLEALDNRLEMLSINWLTGEITIVLAKEIPLEQRKHLGVAP